MQQSATGWGTHLPVALRSQGKGTALTAAGRKGFAKNNGLEHCTPQNAKERLEVASPTHRTVVISSAEPFGRCQKELPVVAHTELVDLVTRVVEPPGGQWLGRGDSSFQT